MTDGVRSEFRTDIQALRGVAVSLVVLYHAQLLTLPAGYLGVDIFFVISGYLITGIVKNAIDQERFSFAEFYFRRAKRLLPAAYVTFAVTAALAPYILNSQELRDFAKQLLGAITFTGNIVLLFQAGYFGGAAELKPLLHVWSLAIEEQYYLLLPASLVLVPRRYWAHGAWALVIGTVVLCFVLVQVKPIATFYLLPTRAWELGIGSLAALSPSIGARGKSALRLLFFPAIIALIVVPFLRISAIHPGIDALVVCVATVLVILRRHPMLEANHVSRMLAKVGDISYSLYLTHWPIFAFARNAAVGELSPAYNVIALGLGVASSWLLYRFVEQPTRRLQLRPTAKLAVCALAVSIALATVPYIYANRPSTGADFGHLRRSNDGFSNACVYEDEFVPKPECQNADKPSVLVWGDSLAMHLVTGIAATSPSGVIQATRGMCGPLIGLAPLAERFYQSAWANSCIQFNQSVLDFVSRSPSIEIVVLASAFRQYLEPSMGRQRWHTLGLVDGKVVEREPSVAVAVEHMRDTIMKLRALGKRVVIVAPIPASGFDVGACVERRTLRKLVLGAPDLDCRIPVRLYEVFYSQTRDFLDQVEHAGDITVIRFDEYLCTNAYCDSQREGVLLYVDSVHMTHEGSRLVAERTHLGAQIRAHAK